MLRSDGEGLSDGGEGEVVQFLVGDDVGELSFRVLRGEDDAVGDVLHQVLQEGRLVLKLE